MPKSVYPASDGGYLITGQVYCDDTNFDVFVIKTNEYGDTLWTKTYDGFGNPDRGKCIIETNNENVIICGYSQEYNSRTIYGLIWYLNEQGETIWLELVDHDIGWEHFSIINLPDSTFITMCAYNYTGKFYNFDIEYNILWEWENTGGGTGDRSFRYDDNCLIYASGPDITLHKDSLPQVSINYDNVELSESYLNIYPNPFNPEATINFSLPKSGTVELSIHNTKGQKVKTLVNEYIQKGIKKEIIWYGTDSFDKIVSSGIYIVYIKLNNKIIATKKLTIIK